MTPITSTLWLSFLLPVSRLTDAFHSRRKAISHKHANPLEIDLERVYDKQGAAALSERTDTVSGEESGDLVLFDRVAFGFMLRLADTGPEACARMARHFRKTGLGRQVTTPSGPLSARLTVPLEAGIVARATVALHGDDLEGGVLLSSGSTIEMNLQDVVRQRHGVPNDRVGFDRKRNFSVATENCDDHDVELQFAAIANCIDRLRTEIASALPGAVEVESRLWLRVAEVCHDLACDNPDDVARTTCKIPPAGSRQSWDSHWDCTFGAGRSATWHFVTQKNGPVRKGYAKAPGLLRTEVSCGRREAVVACLQERTFADLTGEGGRQLAEAFYDAAGEICCTMLDHVKEVMSAGKTMLNLLDELAPLKAVASGERTGRGYTPGFLARREANRIYEALVQDGIAHAAGLRKGTKVRDILDELAHPGGPLVRGATNGIFCIAPAFGRRIRPSNEDGSEPASEASGDADLVDA